MDNINCMKCRVGDFKHGLCDESVCERFGAEGNQDDFINLIPTWIPCSERLPEEDRAFLVTNSQWGYPILEITYWLTDGWQTKGKPIAWMPLPEPWKEETE